MRKTLKKYFVPHAENNYHPHILHTKRAVLYAAVFLLVKVLVVGFALLLPSAVFVLPNVLAEQQSKIINLTNEWRARNGLPDLVEAAKLDLSSSLKASDMADKSYFSHTSPAGHKLAYFLNKAGYEYRVAGENLALGFTDVEEVVNAWIKSPTHYANLIDKDFQEIGVDIESGIYDGQPTVYIAEHFGAPAVEAATIEVGAKQKIAGVEISRSDTGAPIEYNRRDAKVYWEEKNGATTLTVEAEIKGEVDSAVVTINNYLIELQTDGHDSYFGSLTVRAPADDFFKVIISPAISIIGKDGATINDSVDWDRAKIVSPTPMQKYIYARDWLGKYFALFAVSKDIYLFFIIFFSIALLINIFVEIKKQHHHIIVQTLALIGLITCLFVV